MQKQLLIAFISRLSRKFDDQPYLCRLYQALFCTTYFGLLHIGEVTQSPHMILACDVHIVRNKDKLMMILHSSKMHGKGNKPQIIKLTRDKVTSQQSISKQCSHSNLCPYHLLRCYIEVRKSFISTDEQFFVFKDCSPVTPEATHKVFRDCISDISLNSNSYAFHGFCAGRALTCWKWALV